NAGVVHQRPRPEAAGIRSRPGQAAQPPHAAAPPARWRAAAAATEPRRRPEARLARSRAAADEVSDAEDVPFDEAGLGEPALDGRRRLRVIVDRRPHVE